MKKITPTVGVVIIDVDKVCLVRHGESASHLTGVYGLPGGRLQVGEDLINAAAREAEEETGLRINITDLKKLPHIFHADIPRKGGEILSVSWTVFVTNKFTGSLASSDETEPEWVEISRVSKFNLLPNTENAIREGLQLLSK